VPEKHRRIAYVKRRTVEERRLKLDLLNEFNEAYILIPDTKYTLRYPTVKKACIPIPTVDKSRNHNHA